MNVMILVYAHACWLLFNDKLSLVSPVLVATPVKTLQPPLSVTARSQLK